MTSSPATPSFATSRFAASRLATSRLTRATAMAIALALPPTSAALAHSKEKTQPLDGATEKVVERVVMRFDAPMRVTVFKLTRGADAVDVERSAGMEPVTRFTATPDDALAPGAYAVEWRGLSADGHPMNGTFSFTVAE